MDFQTHQEEAKQNTTRLIVLLILGVIAIIAVVSVLMIGLLYYGSGELQPISAIAVAAPLTTIGVVGASLVKSSQIKSGGGSYVAVSMGGRPIDFNTQDLAEKQLVNALEASGGVSEKTKAIAYDLGQVAEEGKNTQSAMDWYLKIFEIDINYKDVANKIENLKQESV